MAVQRPSGARSGMSADASGGDAAGVAARSGAVSPGGDGFAPSALGTQEHWDAVYERELRTFQEYGDRGEIWFGEESMNRLIRWMQKHKIPLDASVLDIGTGNGVFLVELDLNFSKSCQHPHSASEVDPGAVWRRWFSRKREASPWTHSVSFLKQLYIKVHLTRKMQVQIDA
ncbi:EEF1A lysine methyltransferase 2 isoform X3 [Pteropus vampyrus]|uniref:EEF1A lysine methyltransferase 2 isoform X3 n=1 Tax=Pteropus vampyrus TaxID=132908 RepID=A0A6P6CQH0_PTEVA|nr:EEF1A lysine methyltransferase 2 isoform X3 [Pteropus vampyrus]